MSDIDNDTLAELKCIVRNAPPLAGVYFWKDSKGEVLYVGKAINIKNRLTSYFTDKSLKTQHLVKNASTIEWIVVDSEYEALVLENNLIKRYQPHYNIQLKDQKTYPYIRMTKEAFPYVFRTRTRVQDGSEYFGPYPGVGQVDAYLDLIKKMFNLRQCSDVPIKKRKEPCLYYHLGKCSAPCVGLIDEYNYGIEVEKVRQLLRGKVEAFIAELHRRMQDYSLNLNYEKAIEIRDIMRSVKMSTLVQRVEDHEVEWRDYVGFAGLKGFYCFVILRMRDGKMSGKTSFRVESFAEPEEAMNEFLLNYYGDEHNSELPNTVFIENMPYTVDYEKFFKEQNNITIKLALPLTKRDVGLLRMAFENATLDLMRQTDREGSLKELKEVLGLKKIPHRIEGIDVAQLNGHFTVASLVSFWDGVPDKSNYRHFKMKSVADGEINDFKSIAEAVSRRFTRLLNEGLALPDLLLIDGGKGQVSSAYSVLCALGLENEVELAGLAKREEELFRPHQSNPILLEKGSLALRLCQAVRDETHRKATGYNQQLRASTLSLSQLEEVKGIGSVKSKALLKEFGSLQGIMRQPLSLIAKIAQIPYEKAEELVQVLNKNIKNEVESE